MDERTLRVLEFDKILLMLKERTCSVMGRELAERLVPFTEYKAVVNALSDTTDSVNILLTRGSPPPGGLHDIRGAAERVRIGGTLGTHDLLNTAGFLSACRAYKQYADSAHKNEDEENRQLELINGLMLDRELENRIFSAIKSEDEIADNASSELASIRKKIREKQESIRDKLNAALYSPKYQKIIQDPIITMRVGRYVIPIRQENRNDFPGIVHDVSASGATLFMEPMSVVEANNDIRELLVREQREIERILAELSDAVRGRIGGILSDISIMTVVDFSFAKAKLAIDFGCVCPAVSNNKIIEIKKGRHPLLNRNNVVPIDIAIGENYQTLVITGPNTGGKTVSLKTAGLLSLMAQAGLHIPAQEGSQISVFSKIYADIGDEQSIAQSLSTFSSHMKHIVEIMGNADNNTLVLLDELGAGTDPTEGAALGIAILENLGLGGTLTIATTHYAELKIYAETTPSVENASCEFDINTLKPTYRLLTGMPGRSNAFAISAKLGLGNHIIGRAKEFLSSEEIRFEDMLNSIERDRKSAEEALLFADRQKLEAQKLKKEIDNKKNEMEKQRQRYLREAKKEAAGLLEKAKSDAKEILAKLRNLTDVPDSKERNREGQKLYQEIKAELDRVEGSMSSGFRAGAGGKAEEHSTFGRREMVFKPGERVKSLSLNMEGDVLTYPDKNGEMIVQFGLIKINVHISDLEYIDENIHTGQPTVTVPTVAVPTVARMRIASAEVDIRGMTVDEALPLVDRYIEDAMAAGLHVITIIHGKGTGALRRGVHVHLKTNKNVKAFRLGNIGEGDAGVTVAEF